MPHPVPRPLAIGLDERLLQALKRSKGRSEEQPLSRQHAVGGYLAPQYRCVKRQSIGRHMNYRAIRPVAQLNPYFFGRRTRQCFVLPMFFTVPPIPALRMAVTAAPISF